MLRERRIYKATMLYWASGIAGKGVHYGYLRVTYYVPWLLVVASNSMQFFHMIK